MVTEEQLEEINYIISLADRGSWETSLDLSGLSIDSETLEKVMPEILKIPNLTKLDVSYNNLTSLPNSIAKLSSLTHLMATDNEIQDLCDTLDNLGNLENFDFRRNPLSPESGNHLIHIRQTIQDIADDYKYALSILYPNDKERVEIAMQIETSDLDPASITSETVSNDNIIQNTIIKSSKNAIKLFLSKVSVHNEYELNVYGPTVKMLLSQLQDHNIPFEDRNTIQLGITSSLGNCDTPVKEHLMRVKIAELLKSGEKLSEENYLTIERLALIEAAGKLKNLPPNEKIEAVNALVSLVYSRKQIGHLAAKSKIYSQFWRGENENLTKERNLPPISINSEYGFKILNPDVIKEFIALVGARNIGERHHELNEKKLKELTDNYLSGMGLQNDSIAVEREKHIQKYPEDMQMFIMENPDISDTLFSADMDEAGELMNFPGHQEVLRGLLKNENKEESIKQKYKEYLSEQQNKIKDFVSQKLTPQNAQAEAQKEEQPPLPPRSQARHPTRPQTETQRRELRPLSPPPLPPRHPTRPQTETRRGEPRPLPPPPLPPRHPTRPQTETQRRELRPLPLPPRHPTRTQTETQRRELRPLPPPPLPPRHPTRTQTGERRAQAQMQGESRESTIRDNRYRQMASVQIQPQTEMQRGELRTLSTSARHDRTETQREESRSLQGSSRHRR